MLTYGLVRSDQRIITPINMSLQEVYDQHVQAREICGATYLHRYSKCDEDYRCARLTLCLLLFTIAGEMEKHMYG